MIGIDTNILVRYLTQDDEKQAQAVNKTLEQYANQPDSILINNIVFCELIWVLEKGYKYTKTQIVEAIKYILATKEFAFEEPELLRFALNDYQQLSLDFADSLIGHINKAKKCQYTVTLDKAAAQHENFALC